MRRQAVILASLCLLLAVITKARGQDEFKVELVPITPAIVEMATKVMDGCEPLKGKPIGGINKNGIYTLTGDLFHNGKTYAVIDDEDDVILCEWQKPAWKPVSALNIHAEWNFPSGYREHDGREPYEQPQPFWMLELQNHSLLVVASYVEKQGQNYYVMLFDSGCDRLLDTDFSFGMKPAVKGEYLLTGDASRVKAEWDATYYSKIKNSNFTVVKSWEDSVPWHAMYQEDRPDDSSNYASSSEAGYIILPDDSGSKHPADYIVLRSDPKKRGSDLYPQEMHGKPFAAIYSMQKRVPGVDSIIYVFEKLTGLPREFYPEHPGIEPKIKAEPRWKIKVTGSDKSLVKLLSSDPQR